MSDDHLLVDDSHGIRTITLNRPEAKNALTMVMRMRLCALLSEAEQDPGTRAVVLAAVDPVFSAGVDFKEIASGDSARRITPSRSFWSSTEPPTGNVAARWSRPACSVCASQARASFGSP